MESHNLAGLIELAFVVGLLYWFWKTQTSSLGKDEEQDQGKDRPVEKQQHQPPP